MRKLLPRIRKTFMFVGLLSLALLMFNVSFAQSGSSSLRGTVTDLQGRPVAGATVTLGNAAKNFTRTQETTDSGSYSFSAVPPGTYRIEVEGKGFKKAAVSDVHALIDTPGNIDVQLEIGDISETVSVSAGIDAPLNTTDAS